MPTTRSEYTARIRIKFKDLKQVTAFSASPSLLAERCRLDLTEEYVSELFKEHGSAEIDISCPAEIYFAEGSGGLQEIQSDLNAARQCGAEIELSMKWEKRTD